MSNLKFGRRQADWLLLVIAATCAVLAWVFVTVGAEVAEGGLARFDVAIREFVIAHRSAPATAFFSTVTMLGSKPVLVVLGALAGWGISNRSKTVLLLVALCGVVSAEFVDLIKAGFAVDRPPSIAPGSRSFSFPSGHVSGTTAIATLLSYVAWRRRTGVRFLVPVSIAVVALMAMSRVYLDRHWTSDTLGGGLIGGLLGLSFAALYEFGRHHDRQTSPSAGRTSS